tara:strand:+ start:1840 stop:2325 length:486 start_codon:yes stop_codon:yes gene_type:complete
LIFITAKKVFDKTYCCEKKKKTMKLLDYSLFSNTRLNVLPNELIDHIWYFNYTWASNIIKKHFQKFLKTKVFEISKMLDFVFHNCKFPLSMENYSLYYGKKLLKKKDILSVFTACKCCKRHQINKPDGSSVWEETEFNWTDHCDCKCQCRHLSRFLCRPIY